MAMPRGGIERVLCPPVYEGREPDKAYAYDFKDYLGIISVEIGAIGPFVRAVATGETDAARLPIQINAIGVFSGRTEVDAEDRDDFFDEPRPYGAYFLEQDPPSYVKLPFAEKPGVVRPDNALLEASYRVNRGMDSQIALAITQQSGQPGQSLKLEGGFIEIEGGLDVPSSPELTADISVGGYVSPAVKMTLLSKASAGQGNESDAVGESRLSNRSPVLIERAYSPEPRSLDRPYDRFL